MPIPILSSHAQEVCKRFDKRLAVIVAYDDIDDSVWVATFGVDPLAKDLAAEWGDRIKQTLDLGATLETREDFRATPAARYKARIDSLEDVLHQLAVVFREIASPEEYHDEWVGLCGNIPKPLYDEVMRFEKKEIPDASDNS